MLPPARLLTEKPIDGRLRYWRFTRVFEKTEISIFDPQIVKMAL